MSPAMFPLRGEELGRYRSGGGELVQVISKTDFSFDGRASGALQTVPLAVGIDTSEWKTGVLLVRIHSISGSWSPTAVAKVQPYPLALDPIDPAVIFTGAILQGGAGAAEVTFGGSAVAGSLLTASFNSGLGAQALVVLLFDQGATAAAGAQSFSISVDILGRGR